MYIYVYIYIHIYTCILIYFCVFWCVFVYMCTICIHLQIYMGMYFYTYSSTYLCDIYTRQEVERAKPGQTGLGLEQDQPATSASMNCAQFMISDCGNSLWFEIKTREGRGMYRQICPKGTVLTQGPLPNGSSDLFRVNMGHP